MTILMIVAQILTAIPSLMRAIMEVLALIYHLPKEDRQDVHEQLRDIILKAKAKSFVAPEQAQELEDLLAELRSVK